MKELIRFSLKRRFMNKSTIVFNVIMFLVIGVLCFSKELLEVVNPSVLSTTTVYTKGVEPNVLEYLNTVAKDAFVFKELKGSITKEVEKGNDILEYNGNYILHSKYALKEDVRQTYSHFLTIYQRDKLVYESGNEEFMNAYTNEVDIQNKVHVKNIDISEEKGMVVFFVITSIYFMMISFVSAVASEVVNEKATKTLELILTSIHVKTHFISKMVTGWLVVFLQTLMSGGFLIFWLGIRLFYDQGRGLISIVNKFGILRIPQSNFYQVLHEAGIDSVFIIQIISCLLFLMLGILLMQLIMVIVSSFVSSIEEAGNIQAPFYLLLLAIYYAAVMLNNPRDLIEGLAYYLSFVPFMNMLFMPCRLLIQNVPMHELMLSLSFSIVSIVAIIYKGYKYYEIGVLDYTNRGFIKVFKERRKKVV